MSHLLVTLTDPMSPCFDHSLHCAILSHKSDPFILQHQSLLQVSGKREGSYIVIGALQMERIWLTLFPGFLIQHVISCHTLLPLQLLSLPPSSSLRQDQNIGGGEASDSSHLCNYHSQHHCLRRRWSEVHWPSKSLSPVPEWNTAGQRVLAQQQWDTAAEICVERLWDVDLVVHCQ